MIEFAKDYLRNRHFPDKAVDVLEQCLAEAQKEGRSVVSQANAKLVAQKMVGMPLDANAQIKRLKAILTDHGLMVEKDVATLVRRLSVTMHNLDMRSVRPNAVVLLLGEAASTSDMLADAIAEALFESVERVITIDFSRFSSPHDITMLLGAPPAYVGFGGDLPIYRIAQMPWCVIRCEHIQDCHPQVAEVLIKGLANGMLTDATGKNIYLSEAVILLTADIDLKPHHLGLGHAEPTLSDAEVLLAVNKALHPALLEQVDLICTQLPEAGETRRKWLQQELLTTLADRYRMKGLTLHWDPSLLDWLVSLKQLTRQQDWERFIDDEVSTQLVGYLPEPEAEKGNSLLVAYRDGHLQVEVVSTNSN
jgi:ATP-dependent Clp protease ATP-binding subunit ClpA